MTWKAWPALALLLALSILAGVFSHHWWVGAIVFFVPLAVFLQRHEHRHLRPAMGTPDPTAPDPGPRPQAENLTPDEIIAKYGADLHPNAIQAEVLADLVRSRTLQIAGTRKSAREQAADEAWMAAYVRRYGTDEG